MVIFFRQSGQYYKWVFKWGFNLPRGQACLDKWNLIPEGIDILLTHGPPVGKYRFSSYSQISSIDQKVMGRGHGFLSKSFIYMYP